MSTYDKSTEAVKSELFQLCEEIYNYQQRRCLWDSETSELPLDELQDEFDDCLDSWWYVEDYNEADLRKAVRDTIELADKDQIKKYDGYIELSANRTQWEITADISDMDEECFTDTYDCYVKQAAEAFKAETNQEAFFLGRSGRHVCVENTYENALNYDELCKVQNRLEKEMIEALNNELLKDDKERE